MKIILIFLFVNFLNLVNSYTGIATYYGGKSANNPYCEIKLPSNNRYAALSTKLNVRDYCGKKVVVKNIKTGASTTVTIVDACSSCGKYNIDLSKTAFRKINRNSLSAGEIKVSWE